MCKSVLVILVVFVAVAQGACGRSRPGLLGEGGATPYADVGIEMVVDGAADPQDGVSGSDATSPVDQVDAAAATVDGERPATAGRYVPDVAFPYDGKYLAGGSFEDNQGFGWDTCYTRTPGQFPASITGGAANGNRYIQFESGSCSGVCGPDHPSASQLYMWFDDFRPITDPVGLYFSVVNVAAAATGGGGLVADLKGTLEVYGVNGICEEEVGLATVALGDLSLDGTWQTRCVDMSGVASNHGVGLAVSGPGPFKVGLDAVGLGPPCHRPVDCDKTACVCTYSKDQTCNDSPIVSSLHGKCQTDGTCMCQPGFEKNTATGKCR